MTTMLHELTWGGLVLDGEVEPGAVPWTCKTQADGADLGNPVPLIEEVRSQLTDGSLAVTTGYDNREITFRLRLYATDGDSLALAEAAFMAEVMADQPAPLVWTPPVTGSWPAVFDVVRVDFDRSYHDDWDFDERWRKVRDYTLTFTCLPWARDEDTTVIAALPAPADPELPATYTVIDTCSSTTGWAASTEPSGFWSSVSLTTVDDAVRMQATASAGTEAPLAHGLERTGAIAMGSTPYLTVDIDVSWRGVSYVSDRITIKTDISLDALEPVAVTIPAGALTPTTRRFYFEPPASFSTLRVRNHVTRASTASVAVMRVYEVGQTDRIEIAGSNGFQIARTAKVGGSAPTQAALSFVAPGTSPLVGSTAMIYTGSTAVVPMRTLLLSSATPVIDDTKISGATNDLSVPSVFLVPVGQLREATYSLLARLEFTTSATVEWQARVVDSAGADIPGSDLVVSGTSLLMNSTADPWMIHEVAAIQLPVIEIEGDTTHAVEVTLSMDSGGASVNLDEAWLCDTDHGAVTVVHEPSAFELTTIELRSPQLDSPRPAVVGTWTTYGTQDISRLVTSWGTHLFEPGVLHVFTATDLAKYAECQLTYYRRHHTHPGPDLPEADTE